MRERGAVAVLVSCLRWVVGWARGRAFGSSGETFDWDGHPVPYFHHPYHYTWLNERAVEVALATRVLEGCSSKAVLEVGNVLGHYLPADHTVVDKYERAPGVLNVDVAELGPTSKYDLILAISTLEHVGLDEDEKDPAKPRRAVEALKALLAPGGLLWVTIPVGYNPAFDGDVRSGDLGFTRLAALRREPTRNVWRQVPPETAWSVPYDRLLYTAHAVVVAEFRASDGDAGSNPD